VVPLERQEQVVRLVEMDLKVHREQQVQQAHKAQVEVLAHLEQVVQL
jgi:hypothetical protein